MVHERRRHPRVRVTLYIDWGFNADCALKARVTSFSIGGCFVQTDAGAEVGQIIHLRLWLPEERLLRGSVRYHMPGVGFGLQFEDLTIEDQLALETLVTHYRREEKEKQQADEDNA
ncbi:MAG TPA: PilZ domain-containing protein [Pyrinomonadaceae bacterium]